eukprot:3931801-Amphidinium_carterae.1
MLGRNTVLAFLDKAVRRQGCPHMARTSLISKRETASILHQKAPTPPPFTLHQDEVTPTFLSTAYNTL